VLRWMKLRCIDLSTADGLAPLPMHISWVRNGILVVGMDNEMHVYSQWKCPGQPQQVTALPLTDRSHALPEGIKDTADSSALDTRRSSVATTASFLSPRTTMTKSVSAIKLDASILNLSLLADKDRRKDLTNKAELPKSQSLNSFWLISECGLFEAARLANPILPQYHPKQLMELLNFGKIRRVKAILSHLVRCISGESTGGNRGVSTAGEKDGLNESGRGGVTGAWQRSGSIRNRAMSVTAPHDTTEPVMKTINEEASTDYVEISSIPPLPLYALLAADVDSAFASSGDSDPTVGSGKGKADGKTDADYTTLFDIVDDDTMLDDTFDDTDQPGGVSSTGKTQSNRMAGAVNPNYFSQKQADLLAWHLTRTQLPGMSSLDQMYLLALAQTVANTKIDCRDIDASSPKNG